MGDSKLEDERDALIQTVTEAYSRGAMEMAAFEKAVTRLNTCADRGALEAEAGQLGLQLPVSAATPPSSGRPDAVELSCVSGNLRKEGDWVKARDYRLALKSSNARLDLTEYEGARGFRFFLDVDAASSNLRLTVPEGFEVEDRFSERVSSVVRNKPKGDGGRDNLVVLTGYLRSSTVKIKYRS
jgi:hypothetical protein